MTHVTIKVPQNAMRLAIRGEKVTKGQIIAVVPGGDVVRAPVTGEIGWGRETAVIEAR